MKNGTAAEGVEHLVDAGNRILGDIGGFVELLVVDCDADAARFVWDAHKGARPRRRGVLNEAGR